MTRFDAASAGRRAFTIVGGGQAGLTLAIGLRRSGHDVRLVQDRTAAEIAAGPVMSSQCIFSTAIELERRLGLCLYHDEAPAIEAISVLSYNRVGGSPEIAFTGRLSAPARSVDQRLKFAAWLRLFEAIGGHLDICVADVASVERFARDSDLVVIATGKGELTSIFEIDRQWSPFDVPVRALSMIYLDTQRGDKRSSQIRSTAFGDHGSIMQFDGLSLSGRCEILLFEGLIGSDLDLGAGRMETGDRWAIMGSILARLLPEEAERLTPYSPTDHQAGLGGRVTPNVRKAIGRLPSGRTVLGIGDAVVLHDPLVGQGANNATKMAWLLLSAIAARGGGAFDIEWQLSLADALWRRVRASTIWSNMNLLPASGEAHSFAREASVNPGLADLFAQGFDEPELLLSRLMQRKAA